MAGVDPTVHRGTVVAGMAGTSPAMTGESDVPSQNFPASSLILMPMGTSPAKTIERHAGTGTRVVVYKWQAAAWFSPIATSAGNVLSHVPRMKSGQRG